MSNAPTGSREAAIDLIPKALREDVRVLGDALGQVLREYGGPHLLRAVETLRAHAIAAHQDNAEAAAKAIKQAERLVKRWSPERAEEVARAFTIYFHLVNTAEEQHRIRSLRAADSSGRLVGALGETIKTVTRGTGANNAANLVGKLEFHPVLTAHPTEARRRAVVTGIRRVAELLDRHNDPRSGPSEAAEIRRQLLEQVDILWRTDPLRERRPGPLDEVRSAMSAFDGVLFDVVPQIYQRADTAMKPTKQAGCSPAVVPAFVRLGSWIGGDSDGNPKVTSDVTRRAMDIQAHHVLTALERACFAVGKALTVDVGTTRPSDEVLHLLERAKESRAELFAELSFESPNEPHRVAVLFAAHRVRATREGKEDFAYGAADELSADLRVVQASLAGADASRQAYGALQTLIWQVESFGFHLAELEVRQHSAVHRRALEEIDAGGERSEPTREVLATLRVMAEIQERFKDHNACRRYVVSFTQSADDVAAVYRLAEEALDGREMVLDVVPLFETGDDLAASVKVLDEVIRLKPVKKRLDDTGGRFEVMLGYSDSAKDVGPVSATLALYDVQARLATWAKDNKITLTLFHGRGGALGRGGGPANRAVQAQAPGSVDGRFKLTEQGETIFARYGDPTIARRHIEQVTSAMLLASTPRVENKTQSAAAKFSWIAERMDTAARAAYHELVRTDGFAKWFAYVTPLEELGKLPLGSRPARRGLSVSSLDDLRAIPWVFAWSQARLNLAGWYGLGSGLADVADVTKLRQAYRHWPLFTVMIENAEMSLAKTDPLIARRYLALGGRDDLAERILHEHELTMKWVRKVTDRTRLLEDRPVLGRAVALRNPYVDALSYLQLRALRSLRGEGGDVDEDVNRRLLQITVNGIAAGLQNTG